MTRRHNYDYRKYKAHAHWHEERCGDCGTLFLELSDPAASLHLCRDCFWKRLGRGVVPTPVQKLPSDDDWWTNWVYQDELQQAAKRQGEQNESS